ncbi:MAG: TMEM43 family protein [Patescibacteria group bacterium]
MPFGNFSGIQPGMPANGGIVTRKKEPNLLESVVGVFVGVLLVLGSPIVMWLAESQHTADEFATASVVESSDPAIDGYVSFSGRPKLAEKDAGKACLGGECVYEEVNDQELVTKQSRECGDIRASETVRILGDNGVECDSEGNCEKCYNIERDTWETQKTAVTLNQVRVGSYLANPTENAAFLDIVKTIKDLGKSAVSGRPARKSLETFKLPDTLLVAGEAEGGIVNAPKKNVYVFSAFNREATATKLQERDTQNRIMLRVATFLMLFIGFGMIMGPLQWLGRQFAGIPVLGPIVSQGSRFMIGLAAFILSVPLWIALFLIVTVLKTWWLALLVVILIVAAGFYIAKRNK